MRKLFATGLCGLTILCTSAVLLTSNGFSENVLAGTNSDGSVTINETNFPDEHFREALLALDEGKDGVFTKSEIEGLTELTLTSLSIRSLEGIKYFTSLKELRCNGNSIKELDLSYNTQLEDLACSANELVSLDLTNNKNLSRLECQHAYQNYQSDEDKAKPKLVTLNISGLDKLYSIDCKYNDVSELDLSGKTRLSSLDCTANKLTQLNTGDCSALYSVYCSGNQITSLDFTNNPRLSYLYCQNNKLASLKFGDHSDVRTVEAYYNELTSLDVSNLTKLKSLYCHSNKLKTLKVNGAESLQKLHCYSNQLSKLDVSQCKDLEDLSCSYNLITSLKITGASSLTDLRCIDNKIIELDASNLPLLETLDCFGNGMKLLRIENSTLLVNCYNAGGRQMEMGVSNASYLVAVYENNDVEIECDCTAYIITNKLTVTPVPPTPRPDDILINEDNFPDTVLRKYIINHAFDKNRNDALDKSELKAVDSINLYETGVSSLEGLQYFTEITFLDCGANNLSSIDLTHFPHLLTLDVSENQFTSLDLSANTELLALTCNSNQLTSLDIDKNTQLRVLMCDDNPFTTFRIGACPYLVELITNHRRGANYSAEIYYYDGDEGEFLRYSMNMTFDTTAPTPVPTKKPTPKPTTKPTPSPTKKPTPKPTTKPTPTPTKKATPTPTKKATPTPTKKATPTPTKKATPTPTKKATPTPTKKATPTPTKKATPTPTKKATPTPTKKATPTPTKKATPTPTKKATPTPTKKATPTPTKKATPTPTVKVSAPSGVSAKSSSPTTVDISWTPAPNTDFVQVWRTHKANAEQNDYVLLGTYYASDGKSVSKSLTPGKTYYYKLRSYKKLSNGTNVYSGYSTVVSATPKVDAPTGLKVTATTSDSISLSWNKVSGTSIFYEVWRLDNPNNTPGACLGRYTDTNKVSTNLKSGTTYYYRVRAYYYFKDADGTEHRIYSAYSPMVSAKTK